MMLSVQNELCMQQYMQTTYLQNAGILQSNHSQQTLSVHMTSSMSQLAPAILRVIFLSSVIV